MKVYNENIEKLRENENELNNVKVERKRNEEEYQNNKLKNVIKESKKKINMKKI